MSQPRDRAKDSGPARGHRRRWFLVGWIVAIVAWGLHVVALSLAPLSIVQVTAVYRR